jgi:hypothetical protein
MSETNGIYPIQSIRRHEDDCIGCLEPWDCDCECNTCKAARDNMGKKPELTEYAEYLKRLGETNG